VPTDTQRASNQASVGRPPFTDTHVHFHDLSHPTLRWDWLLPDAGPDPDIGDYSAIKAQRYGPDDFLNETRFHNVERVVHVQSAVGSADPVEETQWLQEHADRVGIPHAIVAYTDLAEPDVERTLDKHAVFANLRGIRDLRYDDYLTDDRWLRGFSVLARRKLVFCDDPLVEHMPLLARVIERYPDLTVCIDHAGFPRRRDAAYFDEWRAEMKQLAKCENTVVKISGLGMGDHGWTTESLRPWILTCLELWGPKRSFFGTNWPVDRLFSSYGDVLDAYAALISGYSADEQLDLFSRNARRVFRID
jgi:predicted TIM-barrel fold metal-dependent hydrolase